MEFHVKKLMVVICVVAAFCPQGATGQQTFDNWAISAGVDGKAVTMTYANPATYLKIESDLDLSGRCRGIGREREHSFKNGVTRAMTPGEVAFYFSEYRGDNAYWDFRENKTASRAFHLRPMQFRRSCGPVDAGNFQGREGLYRGSELAARFPRMVYAQHQGQHHDVL